VLRAVLFDWYDTLARVDGECILAGRRALAARAGVDPEALAVLWRETAEQRMLGRLGSLEQEIAHLLGRLGVVAPRELLAELAAIELASWAAAVSLYPEVRPCLAALKARGYRLGVLSNCSYQAGHVIEHAGLDDLLDTYTLSFRVGLAKPQPEIYAVACAALRASYAETVFVADGAFGELDAAAALGITTVLIEQEGQSRAYGTSTRWDHRVTTLAEVPPLLDALARRDGPAPAG